MAWRLGWKRMDSSRVSLAFTGRPTARAARAARCCTETSSLPPKPPPTRAFSTTTRSGSSSHPNMWATSLRVSKTPWSVVTMRTPPSVGHATAHSGSRNACSVKGVVKLSVTVWAASASAALASPRVMWRCWQRLPPSWMAGAPSAAASCTLRTGSRTSYSTLTARLPSSRARSFSATTRATASPTQRVTSPSAIMTSQSCWRWPTLLTGTSSAVSTASTPGTSRASEVSMETTRARGCGVRRALAWTMPSS